METDWWLIGTIIVVATACMWVLWLFFGLVQEICG
jgi:hypothetical protein